jgi:broad specificity phosphatase PhoE
MFILSELVLVRHGQASFLEEDYDRLSELGEEQMRRLGAYWAARGVRFDRVFSGPLARQRGSAELVGAQFAEAGVSWPDIEPLDALAELPAEDLARKGFAKLLGEDAYVQEQLAAFQAATDRASKTRHFQAAFERVVAYWANGGLGDEGLETWKAFVARVHGALALMTDVNGRGQRIAAFTSGGPTGVAIQHALKTDIETTLGIVWRVRNGSFSEFLFTDGAFSLLSYNAVPHLEDAELLTFR